MDSIQQLPDGDAGPIRLPAHGTTVTAEDLRARLAAAADMDGEIEIDASDVETVGQAVLQLLVATALEVREAGQSLQYINPSQAFVDRVERCRLADAIGLEIGDHS